MVSCAIRTSPQTLQCLPSLKPVDVHVGETADLITIVCSWGAVVSSGAVVILGIVVSSEKVVVPLRSATTVELLSEVELLFLLLHAVNISVLASKTRQSSNASLIVLFITLSLSRSSPSAFILLLYHVFEGLSTIWCEIIEYPPHERRVEDIVLLLRLFCKIFINQLLYAEHILGG